MRELAFLNPGLEINLTDERTDPPKHEQYLYKLGIEEFVRQLGENKQLLHPKPILLEGRRRVRFRNKDQQEVEDDMFVDLVLQYNDSYNDQILCFTNAIPNPDGGTHTDRISHGADARDQSIRQAEQSGEGEGPADFRRRRARGADCRSCPSSIPGRASNRRRR